MGVEEEEDEEEVGRNCVSQGLFGRRAWNSKVALAKYVDVIDNFHKGQVNLFQKKTEMFTMFKNMDDCVSELKDYLVAIRREKVREDKQNAKEKRRVRADRDKIRAQYQAGHCPPCVSWAAAEIAHVLASQSQVL